MGQAVGDTDFSAELLALCPAERNMQAQKLDAKSEHFDKLEELTVSQLFFHLTSLLLRRWPS